MDVLTHVFLLSFQDKESDTQPGLVGQSVAPPILPLGPGAGGRVQEPAVCATQRTKPITQRGPRLKKPGQGDHQSRSELALLHKLWLFSVSVGNASTPNTGTGSTGTSIGSCMLERDCRGKRESSPHPSSSAVVHSSLVTVERQHRLTPLCLPITT